MKFEVKAKSWRRARNHVTDRLRMVGLLGRIQFVDKVSDEADDKGLYTYHADIQNIRRFSRYG